MSGSSDETVKLWDVQTGGVIKTLCGHKQSISHVAISADNAVVALVDEGVHTYVGYRGRIYLWHLNSGGCCITSGVNIKSIVFCPKNPQLFLTLCQGHSSPCAPRPSRIQHLLLNKLD